MQNTVIAAAVRMTLAVGGCLGALGTFGAREAHADDATSADAKREVPDYDGRPKHTSAGDVLLWGPRVVVSPLYFTSEYVLRRPIGFLTVHAEKGRWVTKVEDFFTFGTDRKVGLFPTALFDFGLRPSVGLYFFADDFLAKKNSLRIHAATWGLDWLSLSVTNRVTLADDKASLSMRASWKRRPDHVFYGLGPSSHEVNRSRYSSDIFEAGTMFEARFWRASSVVTRAGIRDQRFRDSTCCGDPSVFQRQSAGTFDALPPGIVSGYTIGYQRIEAAIDSRRSRPEPVGGVRLHVYGEHATDLKSRPGASWAHYGGSVGGFVDLTGKARILSLTASVLFVDPLAGAVDSDIPFTERVTLGGFGLMKGYLYGRLIDRSAAVLTLQYQWPIWVWLDGVANVSMGNVFGPRLKGIEGKLMRMSFDTGFRTVGSPDQALELVIGAGTETIADGMRLNSFRFVLGATQGF